MKHTTEKSARLPVILLYSFLFYGVWSLWELWGSGAVSGAVENEYIAQLIKSGVVKNLIWTLPAVCLARRFRDDVFIRLRDMLTQRVSILKYIPVFLGFTAYLTLGALITKGKLAVSDSFRYSDLIIVLFVGLTEEMVFRGWLLNVTVSEHRKRLPVVVNALMFLLIHFPIWIADGQLADAFVSLNFMCVPILSVIFSWAFLKSRSIWIPIALHMYWDLLTFLFF